MSIATLVLGESGTGKSTSLRNLDPASTLLIQAIPKPLPFRAAQWQPMKRTETGTVGNIVRTDHAGKIAEAISKTNRPVVILDDFQAVLSNEFFRRSHERGYEKFTDLGRNAYDILQACIGSQDWKRVYVLSHTDTNDQGRIKAKTIGKMIDERLTVEGQFTIVLRTIVRDGGYYFSTQNNGMDTVKSPLEMFESSFIENDLKKVDDCIYSFYGQNENEKT